MDERSREVLGILIMAMALLVFLGLISHHPDDFPNAGSPAAVRNWLGLAGAWISYHLYVFTIGYSCIVFPLLLFFLGWNLFLDRPFKPFFRLSMYILALGVFLSTALAMPEVVSDEGSKFGFRLSGLIGGFFAEHLNRYLGTVGAVIVLLTFLLAFLVSATSWSMRESLLGFRDEIRSIFDGIGNRFKQMQSARKRRALAREAEARRRGPIPIAEASPADASASAESDGRSEAERRREERRQRRLAAREGVPQQKGPGVTPYGTPPGAPAGAPIGAPLGGTGRTAPGTKPPPRPTVDPQAGRAGQGTKQAGQPAGRRPPPAAATQRAAAGEKAAAGLTAATAGKAGAATGTAGTGAAAQKPRPAGKYELPSLELLTPPPPESHHIDRQALENKAHFLEEKLREFDIKGDVVGIQPGPVITRYEIKPSPGTRIAKFVNYQDDLALVLQAQRVRVVAPIPGKAAVGIEIPNDSPSVVTLREILQSKAFARSHSKLTMALGKTIEGRPFVVDLGQMPHLLVAGATGSGKSVCLNIIIGSILYRAKPWEVKLILIDPKKLELSLYKKLKHHHLTTREDLNEDVVTTVENAVSVLRSLEMEMERRYRILARAGVRGLEDFNKAVDDGRVQVGEDGKVPDKLPYIVLIVDELADLMVTGARDVEEPIARLAQMSRAVGIHLILATQRPSVDVITGVIKANFPARIAFQVAQKNDSRTIIDRNGAEKLLGQGDMLFVHPREPEPTRVHGAFVSTEDVQRVVSHVAVQPRPEKWKLSGFGATQRSTAPGARGDRDELFEEAAKLVIRHQQGSASLLQRRLRIGYARAGRLIDELEAVGLLGPFDGSKAREVLVDESALANLDEILNPPQDEEEGDEI